MLSEKAKTCVKTAIEERGGTPNRYTMAPDLLVATGILEVYDYAQVGLILSGDKHYVIVSPYGFAWFEFQYALGTAASVFDPWELPVNIGPSQFYNWYMTEQGPQEQITLLCLDTLTYAQLEQYIHLTHTRDHSFRRRYLTECLAQFNGNEPTRIRVPPSAAPLADRQ